VQSILQQDPFSGTVFVFRAKRADRVKLLVYGKRSAIPVLRDLRAKG
jgi:transposase